MQTLSNQNLVVALSTPAGCSTGSSAQAHVLTFFSDGGAPLVSPLSMPAGSTCSMAATGTTSWIHIYNPSAPALRRTTPALAQAITPPNNIDRVALAVHDNGDVYLLAGQSGPSTVAGKTYGQAGGLLVVRYAPDGQVRWVRVYLAAGIALSPASISYANGVLAVMGTCNGGNDSAICYGNEGNFEHTPFLMRLVP